MQVEEGVLYHGQWDKGQRNGRGRQLNSDGSVFEGCWKDDLAHANGRKIFTNG